MKEFGIKHNMSESEENATHNCEDEQRLEKEIDKEIQKFKYFLDETDDLIQLKDYKEMEIANRRAEKIVGRLSDLISQAGRNFISSEAAKKLKLNPIRHETRQIVTLTGTQRQSVPIYDLNIDSLDGNARERIQVTVQRCRLYNHSNTRFNNPKAEI